MADRQWMRVVFAQSAAWQGWSPEEMREMSAVIKAAWDSGDMAVLEAWQAWLDDLSGVTFFGQRCRDFEARVHREAEATRKAAA